MFELAAQLRADGGGPVYDLSLGNPSLEPPQLWKDSLVELLQNEPPGTHRYMTNAGFPEVRAFIAKRESENLGVDLTMERITMTVGAAGGLNVLLRSVIDPGDEVLVPAPYFSEYDHYCANVGASLRPVPATKTFDVDVDAVLAAVTERSRVLLLNSPNNPTGAVYDEDTLAALGAGLTRIAQRRGRTLYVVEDSPYRDVTYDGSRVGSIMPHYANSVFLTSHSKDLGLAGERIGYMAVSPRCEGADLLGRALSFNNRVLGFVNAPALMQRALPKVLGQPGGRVDVGVYAANANRLAGVLRELGFWVRDPKAGLFLFPRLPEGSPTTAEDPGGDVAVTERLRARRTIVVPGTAFGTVGHLRLSLCIDQATLDGAVAAFQAEFG